MSGRGAEAERERVVDGLVMGLGVDEVKENNCVEVPSRECGDSPGVDDLRERA